MCSEAPLKWQEPGVGGEQNFKGFRVPEGSCGFVKKRSRALSTTVRISISVAGSALISAAGRAFSSDTWGLRTVHTSVALVQHREARAS